MFINRPVVSAFLMVEFGSFKVTMKIVYADHRNGRLTGVHEVLCSAGDIACRGLQVFYLGPDGGFMIPVHSKIGKNMRIHSEILVGL